MLNKEYQMNSFLILRNTVSNVFQFQYSEDFLPYLHLSETVSHLQTTLTEWEESGGCFQAFVTATAGLKRELGSRFVPDFSNCKWGLAS